MKSPLGIEFASDSQRILSHSLLAVKPEGGCALLIGDERQSSSFKEKNILRVQMIWPCCNVWQINILKLPEYSKEMNTSKNNICSKKNRFAIDPREQLLAQRWARKRNWRIIGSAHSHPDGEPIPSLIDDYWTFASGLSIIIGESGRIRAWWMSKKQAVLPEKLAIWELK